MLILEIVAFYILALRFVKKIVKIKIDKYQHIDVTLSTSPDRRSSSYIKTIN